MGFKLIIEPIAWQDIDEAIGWYENEGPELGEYFLKNFESAKNKILLNLQIYTQVTLHVRRVILKNFPYKILYHFREDTVYILAVIHTKRSDKFIKKKLNQFKK